MASAFSVRPHPVFQKPCCIQRSIMKMLLMLGLHIIATTAHHNKEHIAERSQRGIALRNHTYRFFYSADYPGCLMACMNDSQCKSLNFWWSTSMCDLNIKTIYSAEAESIRKDLSSTYMGLMREEGTATKQLKTSAPRSCNDVHPSSGDGNYSIDPTSSGNPFTVYCDMTTDGGGWTLIYRTILQTSDKLYSYSTADNYRDVFSYNNARTVPVTVLNQLRHDMGFSQLRFYCYKKQVGRTLHIMTKDSPEGEIVVKYFTNSTQRPASCSSFIVLPDDTSVASQHCSCWGNPFNQREEKWGTSRSAEEDRLHREPIFAHPGLKHILYTIPDVGSLLYCDDHWDYNIQHSVGDKWLIFVR